MQHTECYIKDYPRPQFVRKRWNNLNGEWRFAFDDGNAGEREEWYKAEFPADLTICVPYSYQTLKSGINDKKRHDYIWYQKDVSYSAEELGGDRILLWFEGCDYISKVWVNGTFIGRHEGGYCRFGFDITDAVRKDSSGTYRLTVKCEDTYDATQPRGKRNGWTIRMAAGM